MKLGKIIILLICITLVLLGSGLLYFASSLPMNTLITETITSGNDPLKQNFCKWALFTFHKEHQDIQELEEQVGLNFVIAYQEPICLEIFVWLLDNGADINAVSPLDNLTPLHASLLYNNMELVELIMARGADPSVREKRYNMTACEFLTKLKPRKDPALYKRMQNALQCDCDSL